MNHDTLERLMLDHSLGVLDDDVVELLKAYLNDRPAPAAQDRQLCEVVSIVRQALAMVPPALPPLKLQRGALATGLRRWSMGALAAAACVVFGLVIGLLVSRQATNVPVISRQVSAGPGAPTLVQTGSAVALPQTADGEIWSPQKFITRFDTVKRPRSGGIQWSSPVTTPRLGDGI